MAARKKKKTFNKIVLAYSGGLDTSIIIPWLKENLSTAARSSPCRRDVGQGTELDGLEEKAIKTGASKLYVEDLRKEFVDRLYLSHAQGGRRLRGGLPAGHVVRAPDHRQAHRRDRARRRGGRHLPRLHRQGQRPGALRADDQGVRAGYGNHRTLARVGHQVPRRGNRLRRARTTSR